MTTVIGVSFKRAGKMYYFDPNGLELHIGDQVVVETARGMECGDVVTEVRQVEEDEVVQPLKPVLRVMTEEDRQRVASNEKKEAEAFVIGQQRIAHHKLEMKLVDVEYTLARSSSTLRRTGGSTSANWSRTWPRSLRPASSSGRSACATRPR